MPIPPKPKDFVSGSLGPVGDDAPISREVLAKTVAKDDVLTVSITAGAAFYYILDFWSADLAIVHDPDGPHGPIATWEETLAADSDGGAALPVTRLQRVHVEVGMRVPKNILPAGIVAGELSLQGANLQLTIALSSNYTPSTPPTPQPNPTPGPLPQPGPSGGGGNGSAECTQLQTDLANANRQMAQFQQELANTPAPDGPGTARDQIKQAIALLQSEISAIEATMVEKGCSQVPVGGPRSLTFSSPVYGTFTMSGVILDKWVQCASQKTAAGQNLQDFLGLPVRPARFLRQPNRQLDVQEFEHGAIINVEGTASPIVVYGATYARYHSLGSWDGLLGAPAADEVDANPGRLSVFEGGQIFWDPISGDAHEVHGAILQRWLQLGAAAGPLGSPMTDEMPVIGHTGEIGRYQLFGGSPKPMSAIYFSAATGASELLPPIYGTWLSDRGGPLGDLGFPTGAQQTNSAGTIFHTFQKGIIVTPVGAAPVAITGGLKLQLFRYIVDEDFNVQIKITASTGQQNQGRMPASGQYSGGSQTFGPDTELTVPAVDHGAAGTFIPADLVIDIWMEAISERLVGPDNRDGTITAIYNLDNAWGLIEPAHTHHDGAFTAEFAIQPTDTPAIFDSTRYREQAFWPFSNFDTGALSWAQYERTFRDVEETDKHINLNPLHLSVHLFEILFYETVYKSLAESGNCFGMSLESIYARAARSLFIEPIFDSNSYERDGYVLTGASLNPNSPNSAEVADEINVKHGYQLGAGLINWFLGKWTAGALHDPVRAFRESRDSHKSGDWPLFTVSHDSEFSQEGHAIVPYAWNGDTSPILPGQTWEILCANPNNPPGKYPDNNDDHCKIRIRPFEQQFEFHFDDGSSGQIVWTGSSTDGGRLLSMPFSIMSSQPVTLGDEIFTLLAGAVIIIVAGSATTTQFTDQVGRTLFQTNQNKLVINPDPQARIPNLMPVPHRQATFGGAAPELYYWRRDDGPLRGVKASDTNAMELHHDIQSPADAQYRYVMRAASSLTSISADRGSPNGHRISLHNLGSAAQKVVIHAPAGASTPTNFSIQTAGWQSSHTSPIWFEFTASLSANQELHFHAGNGGTQLTVQSANVDTHLDISMLTRSSDPAAPPIAATRTQVPLPAGQVVRFEPSTWQDTALGSAGVHRAVLAAFGSSQILSSSTI